MGRAFFLNRMVLFLCPTIYLAARRVVAAVAVLQVPADAIVRRPDGPASVLFGPAAARRPVGRRLLVVVVELRALRRVPHLALGALRHVPGAILEVRAAA